MRKYLPPPHKFRPKTLDSTDTVDFTHFRRTVNRYCVAAQLSYSSFQRANNNSLKKERRQKYCMFNFKHMIPKGRGFKPHGHHCIVSLSKKINPSLVLVQPRKTLPYITERFLMGRKESNKKSFKHIHIKLLCDRQESFVIPLFF